LERLAPVTPSGSTGPTGSTGTTGTTGAAGEESAGKVVSFEKGVLTIELNDHTTIKGNVTSETKIKCENPAGNAKMADFGGQGGREDGSDDDQGMGDDDQGMGGMESCGPSLLVPNAMVGEALVNIAPAGNTFIEIELLVTPNTPETEKSNFGDDEFGRQGGGGGGDH
jgi:hypothetical protein